MSKQLGIILPRSIKKKLVPWAAGFVADLFYIATEKGLIQNREWPWDFKAGAQAEVLQPLGVKEFLLLMNNSSEKVDATDLANGTKCCSIIIPVHNKVDYTFQCLRSLMQEVDFRENEVIVVNNASRDATDHVLSHMKHLVRVVHNEENQGFVNACNQGAALARGKYLVFLNNDTVVLPGWLKYLVETVEDKPSVGAVGSMLIYPDGRLQEAGGIIWKDGTGANYGWGGKPQDKRFTYTREVDYCSGASLLVRKELFDKLGGFDERYAPAYYEDTDLCFGVRSLGFKVLYQAASRVVHYEGATAGKNIQSGVKRYQEINRTKFVEKWREVLEREHLTKNANDESLAEIASDRRRGFRALIFDHRVPTPDQDSGSVRMSMILKDLAEWGQVMFVPISTRSAPEYEALLEKAGCRVVYPEDYAETIKKHDFDVAILSRPQVADTVLSTIRKLDKNIQIIYDTVDVHFLRFEREYKLTGDSKAEQEARHYKGVEMRLARSSDQVWCVTAEDKQALTEKVPTANIEIVPNIHALCERGKEFDEREGLLFIGGFEHTPNRDAVHYFIGEVFPLVQQSIPGAKVYVVGSHVPDEIRAYESEEIVVTGYVPDVTSLFHGCRVLIAPLRYGAGMKGKVGHALSYGLPVVTTTIGAEGMGLRDGRQAMIADSPDDFAKAVIEVYRNRELWQQLADVGYTHVQEHFTPQVVGKKIRESIHRLCTQRGA